MTKYTVLLLRPDYVSDNYGEDTYLAHVEAETVLEAQEMAKSEAARADHEDEDAQTIFELSQDYHVLLTTTGHLKDLSVGDTYDGDTR